MRLKTSICAQGASVVLNATGAKFAAAASRRRAVPPLGSVAVSRARILGVVEFVLLPKHEELSVAGRRLSTEHDQLFLLLHLVRHLQNHLVRRSLKVVNEHAGILLPVKQG
mmetsp:Transcript_12594/g.26661  ORF Transcript_12594/g.26661 Transcript_12594/m.26661 type:complete len:111 (+) Transcript_12594:131-463(+)